MANRAFLSTPGAFADVPHAASPRTAGIAAMLKIVQALFLSKEIWIQNGLLFLAARAGVLGDLFPFGPALFAAVLLAGDRRRAVAAGLFVILGGATVLPWHRTVSIAIAVFVTLIMVRPGSPEGRRFGSKAMGHVLAVSLVFAFARAVPAWTFGMSFAEGISIAFEAALIAILTVIALPAVATRWLEGVVRHDRRTLVALGFLVSVAGLGLSEMAWNAFRADELWNRWITLLAALVGGAAGGAAMGTTIGVLSSLTGWIPLGGLGLYGVAGLFAGVFAKRGKVGVAAGYILGQMTVAVHAGGIDEIVWGAAHTGLAIILLAFTPNRWIVRIHRSMPGSDAQNELRLAREMRLREAINERLRQIGSVFAELADVFAGGHVRARDATLDEEGVHAVVEQVWERQCRGCAGFKECWQIQFYQSYWDTVDLVSEGERKGSVTQSDLSKEFRRRCYRESEFLSALNQAIAVRAPEWSGVGGGDVVPEQLRGAARLVENVAGQVKLDTSKAEEYEEALREEFALRGIRLTDVRVRCAGERADVEVVYEGPCDGFGSCTVPLIGVVERVMGERYTGEPECRSTLERSCRVRLVPEPPAVLDVKVARIAKGETSICGDAYSEFDLGGGQVALVLSDGMGTGDRAALESRAAVGLLEKMMRAGFEREFATRTVNAALLARSSDEAFATVDLAVVDLFTGDVEFLKVGSPPTFIKRSNGVEIVRSDSLPVGILDDIELSAEKTVLKVGDAMIMMTDGMLDALPHRSDKEEWVARILRRAESCDPETLVGLLVEKARQFSGGRVDDDMTVMVARLRYRPRMGVVPLAESLAACDGGV